MQRASVFRHAFPLVTALFLVGIPSTSSIAESEDAGRGGGGAWNSVYRIVCPDKNKGGTAFGHKSGGIITAEHIVRGCDTSKLLIRAQSGARTTIKKVVTDVQFDLALLTPTTKDFVKGPLSLTRKTRFNIGAQVSTWGYPSGYRGEMPLLSVGHLAGVQERSVKKGLTIRKWIVNAAINLGNSGGPLLETTSAEVIGVVSSKLAPIPKDLQKALEDLKEKGSSEGKTIARLLEHLRKQTQLLVGFASMNKDLKRFLKDQGVEP